MDDNNGTVTTNTGTVTNNLGVVTINTGTIGTNEKTVTQNTGTVNTNSGIVENHGTVNMNSGKVYNYGGTVKDNTNGIEYFKITIVEGSYLSRSGGDLTNYNKQEWLGQKGNDKTTTSIIITPVNGYYIPDFKVPHNVTAERKTDGSWILTLTSGANLNITLPNAHLLYDDRDENLNDSDDDSGDTVPGQMKNDALYSGINHPNGINSINTPSFATDNLGNQVTLDYGKVIEPISMITAINSMAAQLGISVTQDNVKGCGTVNLTELFANSAADSISVPVSASVSSGQIYEVRFSDGNVITIQCTEAGVLNIPFTKGQESLTYIIIGAEMTPPGNNSVQ